MQVAELGSWQKVRKYGRKELFATTQQTGWTANQGVPNLNPCIVINVIGCPFLSAFPAVIQGEYSKPTL